MLKLLNVFNVRNGMNSESFVPLVYVRAQYKTFAIHLSFIHTIEF